VRTALLGTDPATHTYTAPNESLLPPPRNNEVNADNDAAADPIIPDVDGGKDEDDDGDIDGSEDWRPGNSGFEDKGPHRNPTRKACPRVESDADSTDLEALLPSKRQKVTTEKVKSPAKNPREDILGMLKFVPETPNPTAGRAAYEYSKHKRSGQKNTTGALSADEYSSDDSDSSSANMPISGPNIRRTKLNAVEKEIFDRLTLDSDENITELTFASATGQGVREPGCLIATSKLNRFLPVRGFALGSLLFICYQS